jgi:hypothetical protein
MPINCMYVGRIREGEDRRIGESLVHSIEAYAAEINKVFMPQPSQILKEKEMVQTKPLKEKEMLQTKPWSAQIKLPCCILGRTEVRRVVGRDELLGIVMEM